MDIPNYMMDIINDYYSNNASKLHNMVDKVLLKVHFVNIDKDDFYSLASDIFVTEIIPNYNPEMNFESFLYTVLYKKFCSYMTRNTRYKRCKKIKTKYFDAYGNIVEETIVTHDQSLNSPIKSDELYTLEDIIADKKTLEDIFFNESENRYSEKMEKYLHRLSSVQREVLRMQSIGYKAKDIMLELHLNQKQYEDCLSAIHSYKNISILM